MNENLSEMIGSQGEETPQVFSEEDLSLPETEVIEEVAVQEETTEVPTIQVASLHNWFDANSESFENINEVKVSIRGVDPSKTLIMSIPDGSGENDAEGNQQRVLRIFDNADSTPVLNIPGVGMEIYNKGFQIVHDYDSTKTIKCYGIKQGLMVVFCNKIGPQSIPYNITRLKKKDTAVEIVESDVTSIPQKLLEAANLEDLKILYSQTSKAEGLTTNQSAIDWLLERQAGITDINHLLQIDNVIIDMLK